MYNIIELVDCICRDSTDMQYTIMQISQNVKNGKLISLYSNIPFIFECFHDEQHTHWREKASQKYQPRKSPVNDFLSSSSLSSSSSSSSDRLVQTCVTLSRWFSRKKQQHFTLSSAPAHCFLPILKSHEAV